MSPSEEHEDNYSVSPAAMSDEQIARRDAADALAHFTDYFVTNYPGPNTIISDPNWHAPKIFRAAQYALRSKAILADRDELRALLREITEQARRLNAGRKDYFFTDDLLERAEKLLAGG